MWQPGLTFQSAHIRPRATPRDRAHTLELIASDGTVGSAPIRASTNVICALRRFIPLLVGRSVFAAEERWRASAAWLGTNAVGPRWVAYSAIENAAADLCARSLGVSLVEMLGGPTRRSIPIAVSIASCPGSVDRVIDRSQELVASGVRSFVVRDQRQDWRTAVGLLQALREAHGRAVGLRLVLTEPFSDDEYGECLVAIAELGLEYVQDAVQRSNVRGTPRCTRRAVADWDGVAKALRSPSYHVVSLSVSGWGGVPGIQRLAAACRVFQREVVLSCDLANAREVMLSIHLAAAVPGCTMGIVLPIDLDQTVLARALNGHSVEAYGLNGHSVEAYDLNGHSVEAYDLNGHSVGAYGLNGHSVEAYGMS